MRPEDSEAIIVTLTAIAMCGGACVLWLWSDRSNKARLLIGGLWLVATVAGLVLGPPWNVAVVGATVLGAAVLYAICDDLDRWRR